MAFNKWVPFQDIIFLQERMSRLFDAALSRYVEGEGSGGVWSPPADIYETQDNITLKVELPGVEIDDVKVEVEGGVLTLSGIRKLPENLKEEHVHRMEGSHGNFQRAINLPDIVDSKGIKASLSDGVLEVKVPKAGKGEKKHIDIEVK